MSTARPRHRRGLSRVVLCLAMALGFVLGATPSFAQESGEKEDDCVWFPDIRCKDRQARFEGMTQPMGMPYIFEDPFITSGANLVGIYHESANNGGFRSADVGILALQLRLAITDDLAFIATKDGYAWIDHSTGILSNEQGFLNMTVGFKYAMIKSEENRFILSPAVRYEIPLGNDQVYQGNNDGIFIPSASFAWGPLDRLNLIGSFGGQIPVDSESESTSIFYNMHIQYEVFDWLFPFVEVNGMTWTNSGDGSLKIDTEVGQLPLNTAQAALNTGAFEIAEVANIGSKGMQGRSLITMGWGLRFPIAERLSLGVLYERGLEGKRHFFKNRFTTMATFEY